MAEFTIEVIQRRYPVILKLGFSSLDLAAKSICEMYLQNICQQLDWGNGGTATSQAKEGATKLMRLSVLSGTLGAAILFAVCIIQQLEWGNGGTATNIAETAGHTILKSDVSNGIPLVQSLFDLCVKQQLAWGNGGTAQKITATFSDIVARYA